MSEQKVLRSMVAMKGMAPSVAFSGKAGVKQGDETITTPNLLQQ
jgi:hypothetical protein